MALYTETVMDHFMHPRNVGEIADADGVGEVGNAKCGDIMKMYLKIKDNKIEDVKFETFGCGSAIASSSIATEMIKGRTLDDALALTNQEVVDALGRPMGDSGFNKARPQKMASVYLTLDSKIQFVLEDALDKAMKDTKAASAAVILMDPNTGAILGMANRQIGRAHV